MKKVLFAFLAAFTVTHAFPQLKYNTADSIAASVKISDIAALHKELTANLSTDEEKVRSFYYWIAHNIRYDVNESLKSVKENSKQEPAVVLKSQKAVCHGYAALFMELCNRSGIPCHLVSGYTKLAGKFDRSGHTWNMVFVNDKWQPVDATWGAGGVNHQGRYVKEFTGKYFLTGAVEFLADHYPFDPMWQLVFYPAVLNDYKTPGWTYREKTTKYFNFNDTIFSWSRSDSLEREYASALRMVRFNPGDAVMKEHLAYALFMKGNAEFEKGNKIMAVVFPGKTAGTDAVSTSGAKKTALLDSIENHYKLAEAFYRQIQMKAGGDQEVLKGNLNSLHYNMDVVKKQRQHLPTEKN